MIGWIAQNTLVALVLAALAALGWKLYRRTPALGHGAWLLVLAVLLAPPLPVAPWKGPRDRAAALAQSTLPASMSNREDTLFRSPAMSAKRRANPEASASQSQLDRIARAWRAEAKRRADARHAVGTPGVQALASIRPLVWLLAPAQRGPVDMALGELRGVLDGWSGLASGAARSLFSPFRAASPGFSVAQATDASPALQHGPVHARSNEERAALASGSGAAAPDDAPVARATPSGPSGARGPSRAFATSDVLLALWLAGSVIAAMHLGSRMARFDARLRAGRRGSDARLECMVESAAARLGVRPPRVWIVEGVGTPMVWALGRPRLIWPAGCESPGMSVGDRAVIAHELAHLRRRDHWWAWVEVASLVVLWWHPLAHVARRRLRVYAELSADAWVVWAHPRERRAYADALIDTAARARFARPAPVVLGVVDSRTRAFHRRLRMIMTSTTSRTVRPLVAAGALLLAAGLLPTWSGARAASPALEMQAEPRIDGRILPHLRARRLEAQAQRASNSDDADRAAELYRELAALMPDDASLRERIGRMRYDAEDWQGAFDGWSAAAELDPSDGKSAYNAACAAALLGERDTAMNWLDRALRAGFDMSSYIEDDSDLDSLRKGDRMDGIVRAVQELEEVREAAEEAEDEGDWEAALTAYARAAEVASRSEDDLNNLAMACYNAKEWSRAEAAFRRLADVSDDPDMLYNRACVLALAGEKSRALDALEEAFVGGYAGFGHARTDSDLASIQSEPRFAEMLTRLSRPERLRREAQVAMEFADYSAAAARYREASAADGVTDDFRRSMASELGMAELRAGNFREAARIYREQAASGEDLVNSLYNVACGLALAGDEAEALQYLEASVEAGWSDAQHMLTDADLDPLHNEPGFERLVIAAADQQLFDAIGASDWAEAEADGRAMLEEDPTDGAGHLRVGLALMRRGSADEALKHFQAQVKSETMVFVAHYNIACAYAHMNQKDLAFAALEDAAEAGFGDADHYRYDLDLRNLFDDPRFEAFLHRVERGEFSKKDKHPAALAPSAGAHSHAGGGIAVVAPHQDHAHSTAGGGHITAPAAPSAPAVTSGGGSSGSAPRAPKAKAPRSAGGPG